MSSLGPTLSAPWNRRTKVVVVEALPDGTPDWEEIAKDLGQQRAYERWLRLRGCALVRTIIRSDATQRRPRRRAPRRAARRVARAGPSSDDGDSAPVAASIIMRSTRPGPRRGAERTDTRVPSDAEAFEALRILRAWLFAGPNTTTVFDQDSRPDGAPSRDAFLRIHRDQVRANRPGWTLAGKRRLVTAQAWDEYLAEQTETERERSSRRRAQKKTAAPLSSDDVSAEMDAALGIIVTRTANGGRT